MATISLRIPADTYRRLKQLAKSRRISVDKLVEEWATVSLTAHVTELQFRARATRGNSTRGLALLDELGEREAKGRRSRALTPRDAAGGRKS